MSMSYVLTKSRLVEAQVERLGAYVTAYSLVCQIADGGRVSREEAQECVDRIEAAMAKVLAAAESLERRAAHAAEWVDGGDDGDVWSLCRMASD